MKKSRSYRKMCRQVRCELCRLDDFGVEYKVVKPKRGSERSKAIVIQVKTARKWVKQQILLACIGAYHGFEEDIRGAQRLFQRYSLRTMADLSAAVAEDLNKPGVGNLTRSEIRRVMNELHLNYRQPVQGHLFDSPE